jgi:Protein of unknown function (DUF3618)
VSARPEPAAQPEPTPPVTPGRPGRSAAEIRRDIDVQRQDLGRSVEVLRNKVAELTDWRRQVREHKSELVIGAAVVGFAVGGFLALRRRR